MYKVPIELGYKPICVNNYKMVIPTSINTKPNG